MLNVHVKALSFEKKLVLSVLLVCVCATIISCVTYVIIGSNLYLTLGLIVIVVLSMAAICMHLVRRHTQDESNKLKALIKFVQSADFNSLNKINVRDLDEQFGSDLDKDHKKLFTLIKDMMHHAIDSINTIREENEHLSKESVEISHMQENIIVTFATMIENRDSNTGGHIRRTTSYVMALTEVLRDNNTFSGVIDDRFIHNICFGAPMHDIGKISISDNILNKNGKLTEEEFNVMKNHTVYGGEILKEAFAGVRDTTYRDISYNLAMYHHEKWDGSGYPTGISGDNIPLVARIMAVADVFDALISKRSYKPRMPFDKAFDIMEQGRGSHFDPAVIDAFLSIRSDIEDISTIYSENEDGMF